MNKICLPKVVSVLISLLLFLVLANYTNQYFQKAYSQDDQSQDDQPALDTEWRDSTIIDGDGSSTSPTPLPTVDTTITSDTTTSSSDCSICDCSATSSLSARLYNNSTPELDKLRADKGIKKLKLGKKDDYVKSFKELAGGNFELEVYRKNEKVIRYLILCGQPCQVGQANNGGCGVCKTCVANAGTTVGTCMVSTGSSCAPGQTDGAGACIAGFDCTVNSAVNPPTCTCTQTCRVGPNAVPCNGCQKCNPTTSACEAIDANNCDVNTVPNPPAGHVGCTAPAICNLTSTNPNMRCMCVTIVACMDTPVTYTRQYDSSDGTCWQNRGTPAVPTNIARKCDATTGAQPCNANNTSQTCKDTPNPRASANCWVEDVPVPPSTNKNGRYIRKSFTTGCGCS
ncbi:MAG: hypothetical protein HY094_02720 [Candidatus Melainabacteria bacterium]|nr:hypothetical protein [Candidatus Melainabacteria bacterium]